MFLAPKTDQILSCKVTKSIAILKTPGIMHIVLIGFL